SFLNNINVELNSLLPNMIEEAEESSFFGIQILLGAKTPFDGEGTGVGHDVEARSTLDASSEHKDRMGRRLGHDVVASFALFHLGLQILQGRSYFQHPLE